jgi:hypothetical protein
MLNARRRNAIITNRFWRVPELKIRLSIACRCIHTGVEGFETKAILVRNGYSGCLLILCISPTAIWYHYRHYRAHNQVTEQVLAKKQIEENVREIKKIASH